MHHFCFSSCKATFENTFNGTAHTVGCSLKSVNQNHLKGHLNKSSTNSTGEYSLILFPCKSRRVRLLKALISPITAPVALSNTMLRPSSTLVSAASSAVTSFSSVSASCSRSDSVALASDKP